MGSTVSLSSGHHPRTNGQTTSQPGNGGCSPQCVLLQTHVLELLHALGEVCTQLPNQHLLRFVTVSLLPGLPATSVSAPRGGDIGSLGPGPCPPLPASVEESLLCPAAHLCHHQTPSRPPTGLCLLRNKHDTEQRANATRPSVKKQRIRLHNEVRDRSAYIAILMSQHKTDVSNISVTQIGAQTPCEP